MAVFRKLDKMKEEESKAHFDKKSEYWIDKENNFIVRRRSYSRKGDLLFSLDYSLVEINIPMSDDLFRIPRTAKTVVVNTEEEYFALMGKMSKRK